MIDQTVQIKYIGTEQRWSELSITGRQSVWMPGQIESRSKAEAAYLLATGLFSSPPVPVTAVTGPGGGVGITQIVSLTQAQYDAIVTKDPATLYVIVEG